MEALDRDIKTYFVLKHTRDTISKRLDTLNEKIKKRLIEKAHENKHFPDEVVHESGSFKATLRVKRVRPKIDEGVLEQLLVDKNLWSECTRRQVDHDLVAQAFLEEKLTDSDLRAVDGGAQLQFALSVVNEDV